MAKKFPWVSLGKKTDPELPLEPPIWMGNHSNGEYFHLQTPREAAMREEILRRAERESKRHGMDRREFLASTMGMAVTLTVINELGCGSSSSGGAGGSSEAGVPLPACNNGPIPSNDGGPYVVAPEATCDPSQHLADEYFIFDVQTHCFDGGEWRTRNIVYPTFLNFLGSGCGTTNKLDCMDPQHYGELMFVDSETTMTVITSWPAAQCYPERNLLNNRAIACDLPLSNLGMRNLRDFINQKALSQRCINQVQVMPNDFLERQIEGMYAAVADPMWGCGSWKAYPAWTSDSYPDSKGNAQGYYLTDPIGIAFVEAGLKLGVPNFAIHKGLPIPGFDTTHNQPWDIGPIAKLFPQANFVIYHSGIHAGTGGTSSGIAAIAPTATEMVPYPGYTKSNTPTDPTVLKSSPLTGVNQLIQSLIDSGVIQDPDITCTPNAPHNVYAEMGSAWSNVMNDTVQSQHYIGKLLKYLGPDNIVWGTDCILGGSPQSQIDAFRAFQISPQYQEMYGYPALTVDIKRKIFGLNAAKLYHIDPAAARCKVNASAFAMMKRELDETIGPRRWAAKGPLGPRTVKEFMAHARESRAKGVPG
jgi:predicted TIM-barrel fold metal-dependent hydrolase